MKWWLEKAGALQASVRADEAYGAAEYSSRQIRRSIVHTREDVVLLASYLASLNEQAASIRGLLRIVACLLASLLLIGIMALGAR